MKHALDNPQVSFFKSQTHKINLSHQSMRSRVFRIDSTGLGSCSPSVTRTHDSKQENYFCAGKFVFLDITVCATSYSRRNRIVVYFAFSLPLPAVKIIFLSLCGTVCLKSSVPSVNDRNSDCYVLLMIDVFC
jgi:hypothetical protein